MYEEGLREHTVIIFVLLHHSIVFFVMACFKISEFFQAGWHTNNLLCYGEKQCFCGFFTVFNSRAEDIQDGAIWLYSAVKCHEQSVQDLRPKTIK